jgi:hypothetical protein
MIGTGEPDKFTVRYQNLFPNAAGSQLLSSD